MGKMIRLAWTLQHKMILKTVARAHNGGKTLFTKLGPT